MKILTFPFRFPYTFVIKILVGTLNITSRFNYYKNHVAHCTFHLHAAVVNVMQVTEPMGNLTCIRELQDN